MNFEDVLDDGDFVIEKYDASRSHISDQVMLTIHGWLSDRTKITITKAFSCNDCSRRVTKRILAIVERSN